MAYPDHLTKVFFNKGLSGPFYNYTLSYRHMAYPDHLTKVFFNRGLSGPFYLLFLTDMAYPDQLTGSSRFNIPGWFIQV